MGAVAKHLGVSAALLTAGGLGLALVVTVLAVWGFARPHSETAC